MIMLTPNIREVLDNYYRPNIINYRDYSVENKNYPNQESSALPWLYIRYYI
jgi:hypothetical protein